MRKTKFKVWTGTGMIHSKYNNYPTIGLDLEGNLRYFARKEKDNLKPSYPAFDNGYILLQYTGLKDKNNKEICEGDILNRHWYQSWDEIPSVRFDVKAKIIFEDGGFKCQNLSDLKSKYSIPITDKTLEIIGNIYENPELLEEVSNANKKT